jgi:hypothetical protein
MTRTATATSKRVITGAEDPLTLDAPLAALAKCYTLRAMDEMFYAVGGERGRLTRGGESLDGSIRTTRLFRRVDDEWRLAHHRGSIDDPQMRRAYQAAVGWIPAP